MNDKDYFENYKKGFNIIYSHSEDLAYIKDAEFKYQGVTPKMLKIMGVESLEAVMDNTLEEVPHKECMEEFIPKFNKQDLQIQKDCKRRIFLDVLPFPEDIKAYVVYKTPLINPETNNFVGIRGQLTPLLLPHVAKLLFKIHGAKGLLINQKAPKNAFKEYNLTDMQHMVLFLCLNNYSYTEIALLMSEFVQETTPVQVNSHLEELKLIFHVRTKTQLIEKAIGLNFNSYLPRNLFKPTTINVSSEVASMVDLSTVN